MSDRRGRDSGSTSVLVRSENGVVWITLNRPDRLNAFAGDMRERLADAIETASAEPGTRLLVITGAGRAFCAGADVDVMAGLLERDDEQTFAGFVDDGARVVRAVLSAPQPVIAAINGVAVGAGASLATACDIRVASDAASIGFTFNRIGLHPDWGATHFLPRLVGPGRAAELIFSGRVLSAGEAEQLGIVEHTVPQSEFQQHIDRLAKELAAKPPLAVALAKRSLNSAVQRAELEQALKREAEAQMICFRSGDVREGIAAFREKRPAAFRGK